MATSASTLDYLMSFYHHSSAVPTPTSSSSVEAEPLGDINSDNTTTTTIAHHHQHSNPNNNTPPNHNNHHNNIIMDAKNRKNLADVKYLHPFSTSPSHNGHRHSAGPEGKYYPKSQFLGICKYYSVNKDFSSFFTKFFVLMVDLSECITAKVLQNF